MLSTVRVCGGVRDAPLLAVELGQRTAGEGEVRPHRQGRLVFAAGAIELAGRGQQIAEVGVADRFALGVAQEREGLLRLPGRRQGHAQVGPDPRVIRGELERGPERALGLVPASLEIVAVPRVVPDPRVLGPELHCLLVMLLRLRESPEPIERRGDPAMGQGLIGRGELPSPPGLGDLKRILILLHGAVEVALGLEDPAEVDVDLELLTLRRRLVERGVVADRRGSGRPRSSECRRWRRRAARRVGTRARARAPARRMDAAGDEARRRPVRPEHARPGLPAGRRRPSSKYRFQIRDIH